MFLLTINFIDYMLKCTKSKVEGYIPFILANSGVKILVSKNKNL